jgi:hypothetical protein
VTIDRTRFGKALLVGAVAVCVLFLGLPAAQSQEPTTDPIILKGAPMGGVKFEHKKHVERAGNKCETCHHASKPEKPLKEKTQACTDCHTKPPQAGMKTAKQAAFHDATAKAGTCIDCHKKENAAAKKAPLKCPDCHKKTNV